MYKVNGIDVSALIEFHLSENLCHMLFVVRLLHFDNGLVCVLNRVESVVLVNGDVLTGMGEFASVVDVGRLTKEEWARCKYKQSV